MATVFQNESAWSTAEATNANVDTGIVWTEGQDAASVNNSARGMMAARRKATLDQCGGLVATGTANALTVTTNQVLSTAHLTYGLRLLVYATLANTTSSVSFSPDGLATAPIVRADGAALLVGDIRPGMALDLIYHLGSSHWRCLNIAPAGTSKPSFKAASVGQFIAGTGLVLVTFGTENYDYGSYFAGDVWTPPAGVAFMQTNLIINNGSGSSAMVITLDIYSTGTVLVARAVSPAIPAAAYMSVSAAYQAVCDGATGFYVGVTSSVASYSVQNATSSFLGHMI